MSSGFVQEPFKYWSRSVSRRDHRSRETQASSYTRQILSDPDYLFCKNRVNPGPYRNTRANISSVKDQTPHLIDKEDLWGWHEWLDPRFAKEQSSVSESLYEQGGSYHPPLEQEVIYPDCRPPDPAPVPPTPPPSPVIPATYTYRQFLPASEWVIPHNLGFIPSVELFNSGSSEIDGDVTHPSVNLTIVRFNAEISGFARLN